METRICGIDIETYSSISLADCGVFRYVESPDFEILLIAYAFDDEPVEVIDLTDPATDVESVRQRFTEIVFDQSIMKTAYNAQFEMTAFAKWLGREIDFRQWIDTMVVAATCGLPRSLGDVGKALGLPEDKQKAAIGKQLIRYFCQPCKETKTNGGRTRNLPKHDPEKWKQFIEYNRQDVEAERAIRHMVERYTPDEDEHEAWVLDQEINRRGVLCDRTLAEAAIRISEEHTENLMAEMRELTGLVNPNSPVQLKQWLGVTGSLDKQAVADMVKTETGDRLRVLRLRQELGKTSVSKYEAMQRYMCSDDRCRGLFAFYGASRTGRFAGRGVQLQNLPQNHIDDLETARSVALSGDHDALESLYGNVPDTLSQLIRTSFVAKPGHTFAVADFSAIEARVSAFLAGEHWCVEAFREGADIYCRVAEQMFGVPVQKNGVNGHLRQRGKVAVLALGYGGTTNALVNMGALKMGIPEEDLPDIVERWREANPHIVRYWYKIGDAMMAAVKYHETTELPYGVKVWRTNKLLHVQLPSGRCIRYYDPHLTPNRFGRESIGYSAYDAGKWAKTETWGGKIFENLVQATARDCLVLSMKRVEKRYPNIVMHIHDEMVVETRIEQADETLAFMYECMKEPIEWAPGLPLKGAGYVTPFYKKD